MGETRAHRIERLRRQRADAVKHHRPRTAIDRQLRSTVLNQLRADLKAERQGALAAPPVQLELLDRAK